jgi:geranylgeranyl pyrophosphate synthase
MSVTRTDFLAPVQAELDDFERRLHAVVHADMGPLANAMQQILDAGGKRIRPALVILAANLGQPRIEDVFRTAMAIEFIHNATLIHDDLIDHAPTRRGLPTIHEVLGPGPAVIIGDYYFAKAANLMAQVGDPQIDVRLSQAVMTICYGEMLQFTSQRKYEQSEDEYYEKIGRKTAVLMETSTFCGAVTSGQSKEAVAALERYGHLLGMAFQIADDVLDYLATEAEVGKPVGNDLKEGTVTLPLMLALQDPGVDGGLRRVLDRPHLTDADYAEVVSIVRHSRAIDESYEVARRFGERARAALAGFPPSVHKDALEELTHYVVRRRN